MLRTDANPMHYVRSRRRMAVLTALLFSLLLALPSTSHAAPAQQNGGNDGSTPRSLRIQSQDLEDEDEGANEGDGGDQPSGMPVRRIIIDTDPGVDDAVAIIALLSQTRYPVEVLGIATVAGNATEVAGANNVLNILELLGRRDIPVFVGASAPLSRDPSYTGMLLHGPDGLWFQSFQYPSQSVVDPRDAVVDFYCDTERASWDGATLIALGPLTNIAEAMSTCEYKMRTIGEIVVLGGAKSGGNITPVAEYNVWQDPEAFAAVLDFVKPESYGQPTQPVLTVVPLDAFGQLTINSADVEKLARKGNPAMAYVAPALQQYVSIQEPNGAAGLPDAVAVAMALDPARYGQSQPALIRVMTPDPSLDDEVGGLSLARGVTVVGLTFTERIPMLATDAELSELAKTAFADPNFNLEAALFAIFTSAPDNALFVTDINESRVAKDLFKALTR